MQENYINYYRILDIKIDASEEEILNAYKEKAKKYHPDKNNESIPAKELFQLIQEAKEVLTNQKQRLEYDYKQGIRGKTESIKSSSNVQFHKNTDNWKVVLSGLFVVLLIGIFVGIAITE